MLNIPQAEPLLPTGMSPATARFKIDSKVPIPFARSTHGQQAIPAIAEDERG
ncbi:hypothetical protein [Microcoleus sp. herbarium12]|uniref:hypothetical protein n=1 Tax=Microcoleus sp. herbarium12 TaxID=3055437 RepID=UPI002FCF1410